MFMADLLVALASKLSDQKPIRFVTEIHARTRAWGRVEEDDDGVAEGWVNYPRK